MLTETDESTTAKRRLILRDAVAILSLVLVTVVLFFITLFLFRSFTGHRAELARRWSDRGRQDLHKGKPDQAIASLRTALTYAPGTRSYELLLAQALGESSCKGCAEQSYNYFMGLWEAEPGDGFINLELARLAAKKGDQAGATHFYRASIYGTWEGDGVARRAQVRLEFARYLISNHDLPAARMELLIAGGNTPDDFERDMDLADLLQEAADPTDAWTYYQKALAAKPEDLEALAKAGRLAFKFGDYEDAHRLLERADAMSRRSGKKALNGEELAMLNNSGRLLELMPSNTRRARARVQRILALRELAKKRFDGCTSTFVPPVQPPPALQQLAARWSSVDGTATSSALLDDSDQQDATLRLVFDTEVQTQKVCGGASGDDALVLQLAATSPRQLPSNPQSGSGGGR